jgi:hypothetical protein
VITINGDSASAESSWSYIERDEHDTPGPALAGHYEDRFIREGPAWKFLRRTIHVDIPYTPLDVNEQ